MKKTEQRQTCQYAVKPKTDQNKEFIESIPMTPACQKAFIELSKGDAEPFQFVQELKFGEKYTATDGSIFTKEWAESYVAKLNDAPIVGSKDGHTAMNWERSRERVSNEVYLIGSKFADDETVLLRHYVTKDMPEHEYNKLVKEIKAGLVSTSIMCMAEYNIVYNEEDESAVWYAVKSIGGERNDLVEWNQTGMVSGLVAVSQKSPVVNNEKGDKPMEALDINGAFAVLQTACKELKVDPVVIAEKLGFKEKLVTDEVKQKAEKLDKAEAIVGDIGVFVEKQIQAQKDNFATIKAVALEKEFGTNDVAKDVASDLIGDAPVAQKDLEAKIEEIKALASMKKILSASADNRQKEHGNGTSAKDADVYIV